MKKPKATLTAEPYPDEAGCECAAGLYARYGAHFARERGVELPPFRDLRRGVGAWLAAKMVAR